MLLSKGSFVKVFISWSGEKSREIGNAFKDWLPDVLQFVQPYFTPNDIDKGQRWASEIAENLESSKVGLICLTADNLESPWLMFEAGAISKNISSRLCPLLFGVDTSQLIGPLIQFQATPYSKAEVFKFIETINATGELQALTSIQLERAFERCWKELDDKIQIILEKQPIAVQPAPRSTVDMIEEMLGLIRSLPHAAVPLPDHPH
jgi:TIR domain